MFNIHKKTAQASGPCTHPHALPRWDNVDDAGKMDHVSRFYCPACDRFVDPAAMSLDRIRAAEQEQSASQNTGAPASGPASPRPLKS